MATVVDFTGLASSASVVLPIALPPPNCSLAAFTPPILTSRFIWQVCAANKVRPGVCLGGVASRR